jgi:hypothetical protein
MNDSTRVQPLQSAAPRLLRATGGEWRHDERWRVGHQGLGGKAGIERGGAISGRPVLSPAPASSTSLGSPIWTGHARPTGALSADQADPN